jgi:UDP-N-acetyl-2-amino-2-deoxyglucuronate dehydrogenase
MSVTPDKPIGKLCLIGTGGAAAMSASAVRGMRGARITAVSGAHDEHRQEFAARFGIPRHYRDTRQMLEQERPEAVIIASIPSQHWRDIVMSSDYCGILIVEKPLLTQPDSLPKLRELVARKDLSLSVVYQRRFDVAYGKLKRWLPSVKGRIHRIDAVSVDYRPPSYFAGVGAWRCGDESAGGGVLLQHGIHTINQLFSLFDYDYTLLHVNKTYDARIETEGAVTAHFLLRGNIPCSLYSSRLSPALANGITAFGDGFACATGPASFCVRQASSSAARSSRLGKWIGSLPRYAVGTHARFLQEVLSRNGAGKRHSLFLDDALRDLELIWEVYGWTPG